MKRIYSLLILAIALFSASCSEDHGDLLLQGSTADAATLNLTLNETSFNLLDLSEAVSFDLSSVDGGAVSSVDVMLAYGTKPSVALGTYNVGDNISLSATEAFAKVGEDVANAAAGDTFSFTFVLNMASGATTNIGNIVQSSVICKIPETFAVGTYTYQPIPGNEIIFGGEQEVTLSVDPVTSTKRVISSLIYLEPFAIGNGPAEWTIDLICGEVHFVKQGTGLGCGGGGIDLGPADTPGSFDLSSDTIKVTLFDGYDGADGGCGFGPDFYEFYLIKK